MSTQTETPSEPSDTATLEEKRPWALKALPPFPAVALQLLSLLDDSEVPMKKIVDLLRIDPALSAEILRVSNSALYGLSRKIDNVSHAIVVLGTEAVKRLALTVALGRFSHSFLRHEGLRICWDHSVAVALISEELAVQLSEPTDRAYTAGLLHDIGRLALLACYPVEYSNVLAVAREHDFDELECERQLFDVDHCAAGEWLGHYWNLPADFVAAIAGHHSTAPNDRSLVSIVTAGNMVADSIGFSVLEVPARVAVADVVSGLPLRNRESTVEILEGFADRIHSTIGAVTPSLFCAG